MTTTITEQLRANVRDRYNEANSKNEQLKLTLEQHHRNITDIINKYAWDPCLWKNILDVMFGLYLIESNDPPPLIVAMHKCYKQVYSNITDANKLISEYTDAIQKEDDEDEDIYYIGDEDIFCDGDEYMSYDVDDDDYGYNEKYINLIKIFKSYMPAIYNKIHDMLNNIRKLQSLITKANNDIELRQQHNLDLNGMLSYVSRWQFKVKQFLINYETDKKSLHESEIFIKNYESYRFAADFDLETARFVNCEEEKAQPKPDTIPEKQPSQKKRTSRKN